MLRILAVLLAAGILCEAALFSAVLYCCGRAYPEKSADCVIVPGCRVWATGAVSNSLRYRLDAAYKAYSRGNAGKIIVTGGKGSNEPVSEAEAARRYLTSKGVPGSDIYTEELSTDTAGNMKNARRIMDEQGLSTALIATNDYHVTRAVWTARDAGIEAYALPAKSSSEPLTWLRDHFRETLSWVKYAGKKLTGLIIK